MTTILELREAVETARRIWTDPAVLDRVITALIRRAARSRQGAS